NGQRWIFLKKGLDDFRDGFPPSCKNMIVYGRKRPTSITLQKSALKSSSTVLWEKRTESSKTQVCLSKLSLLQQVRRDYVARMECCLKQNPGVLYPCLEKSTSPKLLREDAGVPDPEGLLKSKAGAGVHEQENQHLQEVLHRMEDMQSKVTASKTRVRGRASGGKPLRTWLSKKVAGGEEEAMLTDLAPLKENTKRAIKHYCDWVMSWVPSQTKGERIRYGAWYLDPTVWRRRKANEQLKAPEGTLNSLGNAKEGSEKETEVTQLHSTQAFKEFLGRKGYGKPRFLLKILSGGKESRAPEKITKACKNLYKEM
ncbi:protein FAM47E-like, partial [Alca torda]